MHLCADEIMAVTAALTAAIPLLPRYRARILRVMRRILYRAPVSLQQLVIPSDPVLEREADELKIWLEVVAPLLSTNGAPYGWQKRTCSDGSAFVANGRIFPLYPTPVNATYEDGPRGFVRKVS